MNEQQFTMGVTTGSYKDGKWIERRQTGRLVTEDEIRQTIGFYINMIGKGDDDLYYIEESNWEEEEFGEIVLTAATEPYTEVVIKTHKVNL